MKSKLVDEIKADIPRATQIGRTILSKINWATPGELIEFTDEEIKFLKSDSNGIWFGFNKSNELTITTEEALAIRGLLEREYISREVSGAYEAIEKIIRFANEQLANRTS